MVRPAEYIRTSLERAWILDAQLPAVKGENAKYKLLLQVLDIVMKKEWFLLNLLKRNVGDCYAKDPVSTIFHGKFGTNFGKTMKSKGDKKGCVGPPSIVKKSYAAALKCSGTSTRFAPDLRNLILRIGGHVTEISYV